METIDFALFILIGLAIFIIFTKAWMSFINFIGKGISKLFKWMFK